MSRSNYSDDCEDQWSMIRWRGAVNAAIKGKRGQALLRELRDALDAMPDKSLIANKLAADGEYCALGVLGAKRGVDMSKLDPDEYDAVAQVFDIAPALAREIVFENDEQFDCHRWVQVTLVGPPRQWSPDYGRHVREIMVADENAPARRWQHMRNWVEENIIKDAA